MWHMKRKGQKPQRQEKVLKKQTPGHMARTNTYASHTGVGCIWTPQKGNTIISEASCITHVINAVHANIIRLFCIE